MRILVLGINYAPEPIGIGPCNTALCNWLRSQGHDVDVITAFSYYPSWKKNPGDASRWFRTEEIHGVHVHRCWLYVPRRPAAWRRILHEASFAATALVRSLLLAPADVCIVVSPPLVLGLAGWILRVVKRAPFLFHVQDMQPDAAVALGMLKRGAVSKSLYALEALVYRMANRVSGITRGMMQIFRDKGLSQSKLVLLPNSVCLPPASMLESRGAFRARHNIGPDRFVAAYSGNVGAKQGIEVLFGACELLPDQRVSLVICGDGAHRDQLNRKARPDSAVPLLLPLQPRQEYEQMLVDADCCIITQKTGTGACFFPSKLLTAAAFGKAVIAVADDDSELAKVVRDGGFGVVVEPGNPQAVAATLQRMAANRPWVVEMGCRARRYAGRFESHRVLAGFEYALREMMSPVDPHFSVSRLSVAE